MENENGYPVAPQPPMMHGLTCRLSLGEETSVETRIASKEAEIAQSTESLRKYGIARKIVNYCLYGSMAIGISCAVIHDGIKVSRKHNAPQEVREYAQIREAYSDLQVKIEEIQKSPFRVYTQSEKSSSKVTEILEKAQRKVSEANAQQLESLTDAASSFQSMRQYAEANDPNILDYRVTTLEMTSPYMLGLAASFLGIALGGIGLCVVDQKQRKLDNRRMISKTELANLDNVKRRKDMRI
ncbi:MAG: hypothetical protein WCI72_02265 [archaeon]